MAIKSAKNEPTDSDIKTSLTFLGAKSEDEINDIIEYTWYKVECFKCGKIISLETCDFECGEVPVCKGGCAG